MALEPQTASFPFIAGINQRTDPLTAPPPRLAVLENAVFSTPGRLTKRNGHRALGRTVLGRDTPLDNVQAMMPYGDELVACDRESLYSYEPSEDGWIEKGKLQSLYCTQQPVIRDSNEQTAQDEVTHPLGVKLCAWEQAGGARYAIISVATGKPIVSSTLIGARAVKPKTLAIGSFVVLLWYDTGDHLLHAATFPVANPRLPLTSVALTADLGDAASVSRSAPNYDGCVVQTAAGEQLYVAFNNAAPSGGTTILRMLADSPTAIASSTTRVAAVAAVINIFGDLYAQGPVLHWSNGTQVWFAAYDAQLTRQLGTGMLMSLSPHPFVGIPGSAIIKSLTGVSVSATTIDLRFFGSVGSTQALPPYNVVDDPLWNVVYVSSCKGTVQGSLLSYMLGTPWVQRINYALDGVRTSRFGLWLTSYALGTPWNGRGSMPIATPAPVKRGAGLVTKAWAYNGRAHVVVAYQSPPGLFADTRPQGTYFVIDEEGSESAKLLSGLGGGIPVPVAGLGTVMLAEVSAPTSMQRRFALLATDRITTSAGVAGGTAINLPSGAPSIQVQTQTGVVSDTIEYFNPTNSYLRAECGGTLNLSGGFISMYDGSNVCELGFHLFPEQPDLASEVVPFGEKGLSAGTYSYVAIYQWTDTQGQTHRSAPSNPQNIALAAGFYPSPHQAEPLKYKVTATTSRLYFTKKKSVQIVFARTAGSTTGTIFTQLDPVSNDLNVPFSPYVSFEDTTTDDALGAQPALYAQGDGSGEVENVPPGPVTSLAVHASRLYALDSIDRLTVWWSKQCITTSASVIGSPVEFSDFFTTDVDAFGGDLTALAGMDDKLILAKAGAMFYQTGQGPPASGDQSQNDFGIPTVATTAYGCVNPRSVTITPDGVLIQSAKGIWELDRGLRARFTGAPAQDLSQQLVTSGITVPDTTQVRLTLAPGATRPDAVAVFDYVAGQWSTFTGMPAVDACIWQSQYVWMRADGTAFVETPGRFTDAGRFIRMRAVTSNFRLAGLQGFAAVWKVLLLGEYRSAHQLRVRAAYNGAGFTQEGVIRAPPPPNWGGDSVWGGGAPGDTTAWGGEYPTYEWLFYPKNQFCEAIQLSFEDEPLPGSDPGESATWSAISFEYGANRGLNRRPAKASFG